MTRRTFLHGAALSAPALIPPPGRRSRAERDAVEVVRRFDAASDAFAAACDRDPYGNIDDPVSQGWSAAHRALKAAFPTLGPLCCGIILDGRLYVLPPDPYDLDEDADARREIIVVDLARIADLDGGHSR